MDVSRKKNTVKMMGNLEVKEQVTAANIVVNGSLMVNGKNITADKNYSNELHIGNPNEDGCWKLTNVDGELLFSQRSDGKWEEKQMMS
jgi:hypothetical protein